jgi:hypothetical protein
MTLQELQNQALQLPIGDRWQLAQALLESLKQEARPKRLFSILYENARGKHFKVVAEGLKPSKPVDSIRSNILIPKESPKLKRGNLSQLRGIAKSPTTQVEADAKEDYVTYLTEKY